MAQFSPEKLLAIYNNEQKDPQLHSVLRLITFKEHLDVNGVPSSEPSSQGQWINTEEVTERP